MAKKAACAAPVTHHDQDAKKSQQLADLHTDVECQQIGEQTVAGNLKFLNLRRQTKAVKEAKDQRGGFGVRLNTKPALKGPRLSKAL